MKLSTVSTLSAIAIFVASMPPAVGALVTKKNQPVQVALTGETILPSPKLVAKSIARKKLNKVFGKQARQEWKALAKLWGKESAWNYRAKNPHSSAYGIAQVLGTPQGSTIQYQVNKGLQYIVHRYDTPTKAWSFWKRNGWY
jgi:hypothetical protein